MIKYSLFFSSFLLGQTLIVQAQEVNSHRFYIQQYKDLAIQEMLRTNIPASITLAQAILESNAGQSEVALMAQNQFGIKCGNSWLGPTYQKKDDDYDINGVLTFSCFRVYPSPDASFQDHSNFLTDPQKAYRYGSLFSLDNTDYQGWAYGLKEAGYATSEIYPQKLIALIERYDLQQYDLVFSEWRKTTDPAHATVGVSDSTRDNVSKSIVYATLITTINGVPETMASGFETASDIAYRSRMSVERLLDYNEGLVDGYVLPPGEKVYLAPKRNAFDGPLEYHEMQAGESVYDVAQKYGIRLKKLQQRNRLEPDQPLEPGTVLKLSGSRVKTPPVQQTYPTDKPVSPSVEPASPTLPLFHTVEKNDTLWNIAHRYHTDVEQLKQWNNLNDAIIRRGMQLRVH